MQHINIPLCTDQTTEWADATPLYLVTNGYRGDQGARLVGLPQNLQVLAMVNGFEGQYGTVLCGPDGVLVGIGDGTDPLAIGEAGSQVPPGSYYLATDLTPDAAALAAIGWTMGAYRFDRYRAEQRAAPILLLDQRLDIAEITRIAKALKLVRDLINTPASDMTPHNLAETASQLAQQYSAELNIIEGDSLLRHNFPLIHAVGRAAAVAPRLIDLTWGAEDAPRITLVGKGITFDTGGLNIKTGDYMALMKKDMGGGAHALGLAMMVMDAGLPVRLRLLIPAAENAIAGDAFRPGDVLSSRKGTSVEITNTDAEGRLVLADALALACEENPQMLVSLATLTGAARVALGSEIAPLYTTQTECAHALQAIGNAIGDPIWPMPLWDGYNKLLTSPVADLKNCATGNFAGSITAALFLKQFVPATVPFVHFDIYGWNGKARPAHPVGADVFAIRALYAYIKQQHDTGRAGS